MLLRIMLHRAGAPSEELSLHGAVTVGGGPGDAVRVPGTPAAAVALAPALPGAVVEARVPGAVVSLRAGTGGLDRPLAAGRRRLLRAGELLRLPGFAVEVPLEPTPEATGATRLLAGALLRASASGETPLDGPHLVVVEGPDAGRRFAMAATATVGRGRAATVRLSDRRASRLHARVSRAASRFCIEDLGSKNGLFLNRLRLATDAAPLRPGDEISLGETGLVLVGSVAGASAPADLRRDPSGSSPAVADRRPAGNASASLRAALAASAALIASAAALALRALP